VSGESPETPEVEPDAVPDADVVDPALAEAIDIGADTEQEEPAAEEAPDYQDLWVRAVADLDNVRKRARRDAALAEGRGTARLARELLPALDNLERALAAVEAQPENADSHLTDGIRLVQRELLAALERVGIVPDDPSGQQFDPHVHEAVAQAPAEGVAAGTIIEVYSAGYRLGDEVLRAAKVVVAA
jgi:molecular chaperone GrpE